MLEGYRELATLTVAQQDRLLTVTLDRPGALNAVDAAMMADLRSLFRLLRTDESVAAVLVTGAGRAFSTGGDVKELAREAGAAGSGGFSGEPGAALRIGRLLTGSVDLLSAMLDVEQPVVAAVHGYAIGLGATLALCADVVVAAEDAIFADPHVTLGLVPGDGGAVIWPLLLPVNTAKYYLMTGERITGAEAVRLGLVLKAVPESALVAEARAIAQRLADGPALAVRWTKTVLNKIVRERLNLLLDTSLLLEGASMLSEDHAEGLAAMLARRPPNFKSR